MQYELKSFKTNNVSISDTGAAIIKVGVITGIVGNTYGQFIAWDTITIQIIDYASKTGQQTLSEVSAAASAFVASKYPNT